MKVSPPLQSLISALKLMATLWAVEASVASPLPENLTHQWILFVMVEPLNSLILLLVAIWMITNPAQILCKAALIILGVNQQHQQAKVHYRKKKRKNSPLKKYFGSRIILET